MPMIRFICANPKCNNCIDKLYRKIKNVPDEIECEVCGSELERQIGAPSSKTTQVLDNGVQGRQTEIMNEVVEKERDRLYTEE